MKIRELSIKKNAHSVQLPNVVFPYSPSIYKILSMVVGAAVVEGVVGVVVEGVVDVSSNE